MSVSVPLPLLLHNRYLHLGLITPVLVSKLGLTCGMQPVWCLDSFISARRQRAALTPSKKKNTPEQLSFSFPKSSEQSDAVTHAIKESFQN